MLAYCASRISEHMAVDGAGQLVCLACPVARDGEQVYSEREIGISNSDNPIVVLRPTQEVFSRAALASLEGLPLVDNHPPRFVGPENWSAFAKGHVQNVRRGGRLPSGENSVLADLIVSDGNLQQKIKNGKRDISLGYSCDYVVSGDVIMQTNLRYNHAAVVDRGRALNTKILDSAERIRNMTAEDRTKASQALARLSDFFKTKLYVKDAEVRNQARELVAEADRLQEYLRSAPAPGELHAFLTGPQSSEALREWNRQRAENFENQAREAGVAAQRRWGYKTADCRPSLRRATDASASEDFEQQCQRRRRELLAR